MITADIAAKIWNCCREIRSGNKLLKDMAKAAKEFRDQQACPAAERRLWTRAAASAWRSMRRGFPPTFRSPPGACRVDHPRPYRREEVGACRGE